MAALPACVVTVGRRRQVRKSPAGAGVVPPGAAAAPAWGPAQTRPSRAGPPGAAASAGGWVWGSQGELRVCRMHTPVSPGINLGSVTGTGTCGKGHLRLCSSRARGGSPWPAPRCPRPPPGPAPGSPAAPWPRPGGLERSEEHLLKLVKAGEPSCPGRPPAPGPVISLGRGIICLAVLIS